MTFHWAYQAPDGTEPSDRPASQAFPTQSDAETWIGENWRGLLESGVDQVALMEDDHAVYGPMSLRPAD
ncbi:MAG: hypothetical protein Q8M17_02605 [Actinomycetota bacterium]|nr:hypothetical protein [Actinomycetota bacterium]